MIFDALGGPCVRGEDGVRSTVVVESEVKYDIFWCWRIDVGYIELYNFRRTPEMGEYAWDDLASGFGAYIYISVSASSGYNRHRILASP